MKSEKSVSVVLAGYGEEANVDKAMMEIYSALAESFNKYELILVDDASKDSTLNRMIEFASKNRNVYVLPNYVNLNFGTSILRGLYFAKNDYIIYDACDLPLSADDLVRVINGMEADTDLLVLQRTEYLTTKWRKITSNVNKLLLKVLFPKLTRGTPVLNYVQVYKKEILPNIAPLARSPIFVWPELIFRAKLKGYKVDNVPVKCNVEQIRKGSFGHPHDIIWGMYEMLRFRIRLWTGKY